jgi:hypothetical protein
MKQFNLSQMINTLANIGVIAGILFLVLELHQNNELLELEAKATFIESTQDGWDKISSDPGLVDIFIKDRNGETLTEAEEFRMSAFWMGYLIRMEWQFQHFPDESLRMNALRRIHDAYGSFRRTWNGNTAARSAGKDSFSPEFVEYIDTIVLGGT